MTSLLYHPRDWRDRNALLRHCRHLPDFDRWRIARLSWAAIGAAGDERHLLRTARRARRPLTVDELDAVAVLVGEQARLGYLIGWVIDQAAPARVQAA